MKPSLRSPIKWKFRLYISYVASFLEIFLALMLALALVVCSIQVIPTIFQLRVSMETVSVFRVFLEALFELVIGVEALKLLCKHTPGSALEILLFTIAREMIVNHTTPEQNLLVVLSIAVIFAIRRFMYVPAWGSDQEMSSFDEVQLLYRDFRRKKNAQKNNKRYRVCPQSGDDCTSAQEAAETDPLDPASDPDCPDQTTESCTH